MKLSTVLFFSGMAILIGTLIAHAVRVSPEVAQDVATAEAAVASTIRIGRSGPIQIRPGIVLVGGGADGKVYKISVVHWGRNQGRLKIEELKGHDEVH